MRFIVQYFIILFFVISSSADAQRLIERGMTLNPLENPSVDIPEQEYAWFSQVGGWAAFGSYGFYGDDNHQWYQHLGAYVEMFRRGNYASLTVTGQIEFIADPHNDINFSPRAIFWEEGILFTRRIRNSYLQFGYYHRCKHDIDNLELGEERAMVFGSALTRFIMPFSFGSKNDALLAFEYNQYTITWERRIPSEFRDTGYNWNELFSSVTLNAAWARPTGRQTNLYMDGYAMATFFNDDFLMNGKLRAEIGSRTNAGEFRFGIHLEHLGDSGIPVQPKSVTLLGVGIRIMTPGSIR
jgi:hypothetical protein